MVYVVGERKNTGKPEPTVSKERLDSIRAELEPLMRKEDEKEYILNREEKRSLERKLKAKGHSPADIERMIMIKEMMDSRKNLKEGQKVRLNIERLRADVNWPGMNPRYKEWVEAHAGEVFTVKYHPEYSPSRVCLEECDAVEDWLFWDGDLEVVDEPQD